VDREARDANQLNAECDVRSSPSSAQLELEDKDRSNSEPVVRKVGIDAFSSLHRNLSVQSDGIF